MITANEAQKKALEAMQYSEDNRMLTVLPSGAGKTVLAAMFALERGAQTVLYVAHRIEILRQAAKEFARVFTDLPENSFGIVSGPDKAYGSRFVFASIQTLARGENLNVLLNAHQHHFDVVIIDEYHHARAKTYDWLMEQLKGKFKYFLGITATPFRMDGRDVFSHVGGNVIFEMDLKTAMLNKYLVPFRYYAYFDDVDYDRIKWQTGNNFYNIKSLDKAYSIPARDARIIKEYKELGMKGKQTLGFCASVKHAERMAILFANAGIQSRILSHKTSPKYRELAVQQFREGKVKAIFTKDLFNEGIDFPEVECVILLRPTVSKTVFYQQIGRGLRKKEGKTHCVIMDFIGNYRKNFEVNRMLVVEIGAETRPHDERPEFEYQVPTVHFEKRLIEFWEEQEKKNIYIKNTIIEAYLGLRDKLGRPPTRVELYNNTKYNLSFYFGTYLELAKAAGEPEWLIKAIENPKPLEQEQIEAYYTYLKKTGKKLK